MTFRVAACGAVLALGLLFAPAAHAAEDCDGATCKPSKPLDIMKFMREQAASTRTDSKSRPAARPATAQAARPAERKVAARPKPARLPNEAVQSFAAQPQQTTTDKARTNVEVIAAGEVNAIDRAAAPPPAETTGAAAVDGPLVQVVEATELNDIDRKAADAVPTAAAAETGSAPAQASQASVSWLQWIWSAIGSTFVALAAAMHNLVG